MTEKPYIYITGASSGIGEAIARRMAAEGWNLIINARREERLNALAKELINLHGIQVKIQVYDIRNRTEVEHAISSLVTDGIIPHVLVNNAGLAMGLSPFESGSIDDWEVMIDTNIKGLLYITRYMVPHMISAKRGHIVNIGSIAGKEAYPNGNIYCATKTAVDALNKSMRIDMLPYPIKVSAVHPGAVKTEFSQVRFKGDVDRAGKIYEGFESLSGADVADAVCYIVTRPFHVNINDMVIMPVAQAQAGVVHRKNT